MTKVSQILSVIFTVFWVLFIFADYWQKHPVYYYSFSLFDYWGFLITLLLVGGIVVWSALKLGKQEKTQGLFNGLAVFALAMFISVASVGFAYTKTVDNAGFNVPKAVDVFVLVAGSALATWGITLTCYVMGNLLNGLLNIRVKEEDAVVPDLAMGMMGLVLFLFLLGALSLLYSFIILPLAGVLLIARWKKTLDFMNMTLWQPLATDINLNATGLTAFFLLVTLLSINFTALNAPMQAGFDTLTLYSNLPLLIGQHHGLVGGFQPYNWSLLMSLGHVLFNSNEISLALSYLGGALTLYAMYVLGRNWLRLDINLTLVAVLAFALIPVFSGQMFAELKVDLGLLFVYFSIVLLLLNYIRNSNAALDSGKPAALLCPEVLLMGLLSGFSLGIKLTTLYFAFALLCAIWYRHASMRGMFAVFFICLFLVFLLKIDETGGLRRYHAGVDALQWGVLLAGLFLATGVYVRNKKALLDSLRATAIYGVFLVLSFLPWMIKNYVDTGSLAPTQLMSGKEASPAINLQIIEKNWQNSGQ
jgi:hypothetical protein